MAFLVASKGARRARPRVARPAQVRRQTRVAVSAQGGAAPPRKPGQRRSARWRRTSAQAGAVAQRKMAPRLLAGRGNAST
jgi:hypothetical protein